MCEWGDTVELLVPIHADDSHTGEFRWATKKVDRCLADLVSLLNGAGIITRSCCCGHGQGRGYLDLHDGREFGPDRQPESLPFAWDSNNSPADSHNAWWSIHSSIIQQMLRRAHQGEDPELLYIELIANSDSEPVENSDG